MFLSLPSVLQFSFSLHSLHTLRIHNFKVNYSVIPALFGIFESFVEEARPREDVFGSGKAVFFFLFFSY